MGSDRSGSVGAAHRPGVVRGLTRRPRCSPLAPFETYSATCYAVASRSARLRRKEPCAVHVDSMTVNSDSVPASSYGRFKHVARA